MYISRIFIIHEIYICIYFYTVSKSILLNVCKTNENYYDYFTNRFKMMMKNRVDKDARKPGKRWFLFLFRLYFFT